MTRFTPRRGFTLIELLVVMAIIAALAAIAMIVAPGIMDKDRSVDAVSSLESQLQIARARALRDRLPRGVRLIVDPATLRATETQYIESPPVLVFNQNPPYPNGPASPLTPRVEFAYTVTPAGSPGGAGIISGRQCVIRGLDTDQASQLVNAVNSGRQPSLWLPVLGTWHRLIVPPNVPPLGASPPYDVAVTLDQYPDMQLGASTSYVTYHFGIYLPPRPLLGEPVMQLPTRTCVDLNPGLSYPAGSTLADYDILFAPNGQLAFTASTNGTAIGGAGHVFLWIRDFTKIPVDAPFPVTLNVPSAGSNTYATSDFQQGGEMMLLAIKSKSGAIGAGPVNWPDGSTGIYGPPPTGNYDPYFFARKAVAGP